MERRDLFRILGGGVVAGVLQGAPRVLSAGQMAVVDRMLEILLPADETSVSAREAGVGLYLDAALFNGNESARVAWRTGIGQLSRVVEMSDSEAFAFLSRLDAEGDSFFAIFKRSAIDAYYLSEAGRKALGYTGDTAIHDFKGCTHAEHKSG